MGTKWSVVLSYDILVDVYYVILRGCLGTCAMPKFVLSTLQAVHARAAMARLDIETLSMGLARNNAL